MPDERPVTEEALAGMIKALDDIIQETGAVIKAMQNDANECADNMNGDAVAAKAIVRVNKCIGYYRQINERALELRKRMYSKLQSLQAMKDLMDGM